MKDMKLKNIILLLALGMLFACEPKVDEFTTTGGSADFSNYVAVGNSLTSGYTDAELFKSGQQNSFPAILATQFEAAGGGTFNQPLMYDEYGFGNRLLLDVSIPGPVPAGVTPDPANFESIANMGPFNNMGVPGAKSFHMIPGAEAYSAMNPYYKRFAAEPGVSTVLGEAMAQNPTFFTCWVGGNDVLGYALEGGAADSITDPAIFQAALGAILQGMTSNGAKGAIATVPKVTDVPFFQYMNTRVPYNGLVVDSSQAAGLNYVFEQFELYLASLGIIWDYDFTFNAGPNPFLVSDKTLPLPEPFNVRPMKSGELFLLTLPTDSLPKGMGSVDANNGNPVPWGIPDEYVLLDYELEQIDIAQASYNETIKAMANQFDLALVDTYAKFEELNNGGITEDGITFTSDYITGNAFSLDGIHPTGQGYALIANFFIEAINAKYGAALTEVNVSLYPGLYYYH